MDKKEIIEIVRDEMNAIKNEFVNEKTAMSLWFIKNKQTFLEKIKKSETPTYYIDKKRVYKKSDLIKNIKQK